MKLSKERRDRLILVSILSIALSVGIWQLLIKAGMSSLEGTRKTEAKARQDFEDANTFIQRSAELQAAAEDASQEIRRIETTMADSVDPYSWSYDLIEKAGANHEIKILEVESPRGPSVVQMIPDFPYRAITFGVTGQGRYRDIGRFIAEFENDHPHCRTQNLELRALQAANPDAVSEGSSQYLISFRFEIVALVQPTS